eukprot:s665_g11.t1
MDELDELDLNSVKKSLSLLSKDVEDSRSRVLRLVQSKSPEFQQAANQVTELQGLISSLDADLSSLDWLAPVASLPSDTVPNLGYTPCHVQEASQKHAEAEAELHALDSSMEILSIMLQVEDLFQRFERISSANFVQAAELLIQISGLLQKVSAKKGSEATEPDIVWAAKERYRKQRLTLLDSVDSAFARDLRFTEGLVEVRPQLPQLWRCMELLQLQRKRIQAVAEEMLKQFQGILTVRATRLAAEDSAGEAGGVATFRWLDGVSKETVSVLHVMEGYINFMCQYGAGDEAEVYKALGFSLYPRLVKLLVGHLDFADQGPAVEDFERRLQQRGFISDAETSLSRLVHGQREAQSQSPQLLVQARRWILDESEDAVSVELGGDSTKSIQVSPAAEKLARSFGQLSHFADEVRMQTAGRLCWLFAILRPYASSGGLTRHPRRCGLFVTDVMFLIHELEIQPASCRPLKQIKALKRRCQEELHAMTKCQEELRQPSCARDTLLTHLKSCRPVATGNGFLEAETALGAAAGEMKATCAALSSLPRPLLQEVALHLLGLFCHELLAKLLHHDAAAESEAESTARRLQEFRGAMGARMVGVGNRLLESALARGANNDFREVLAGLKGSPSSKAEADSGGPAAAAHAPHVPANLSADEISSAVTLLTSGQCMVRQSLQAAGLDIQLREKVPSYGKLSLTTDLLGSDFIRFRERRNALQKAMSKEEVIRLMALSFYDEALTPEDAWRMLNA